MIVVLKLLISVAIIGLLGGFGGGGWENTFLVPMFDLNRSLVPNQETF